MVPELVTTRVVARSTRPDDGTAFPWMTPATVQLLPAGRVASASFTEKVPKAGLAKASK